MGVCRRAVSGCLLGLATGYQHRGPRNSRVDSSAWGRVPLSERTPCFLPRQCLAPRFSSTGIALFILESTRHQVAWGDALRDTVIPGRNLQRSPQHSRIPSRSTTRKPRLPIAEGTLVRKKTKFLLLRISVILAFTVLAGRLWYVQVVMGSYYKQQADTSKIRLEPVQALRGIIYDRKGRQLVWNTPSWNVEIVPHGIPDARATTIYKQLARTLA